MNFQEHYLNSLRFEMNRYKKLGDSTLDQIRDEDIHWSPSVTDNSIAILVKHMAGNMKSRFTNFLVEDGEKSWRNRDSEFEDPYATKEELIAAWEEGWACVFGALASIHAENFNTQVKIRNEKHSLVEAFNRQLGHYASHVGQIVYIGKMRRGKSWISLSIPKGQSEEFNKKKFR